MKYKFFVGLPHQKIHSRFLHSLIGGDFVQYECDVTETEFPAHVLAQDSHETVWFFNDIYFNLHSKLKGRQVLVGHGVGIGWFMDPERVRTVNRDFDFVWETGRAPEKLSLENQGVEPGKVRRIGYTLLFEIPDRSPEPGRGLFISTYFKSWNHHRNLMEILRRLEDGISAVLTIHPSTPPDIQNALREVSPPGKNITYVSSQEELLEEYARCSCAVGQISSAIAPFYYLNKPVIFLRGCVGRNPFKGIGWERIRREIKDPLFIRILDESMRVSHWRQFSPELLRSAKVSTSARQIFYPSNFDRNETISRIRQCLKELER